MTLSLSICPYTCCLFNFCKTAKYYFSFCVPHFPQQ